MIFKTTTGNKIVISIKNKEALNQLTRKSQGLCLVCLRTSQTDRNKERYLLVSDPIFTPFTSTSLLHLSLPYSSSMIHHPLSSLFPIQICTHLLRASLAHWFPHVYFPLPASLHPAPSTPAPPPPPHIGSFIIGDISDRFGRHRALMFSIVGLLGAGCGTAYMKTYWGIVGFRTASSAFAIGIFMSAFVLGVEMMGPSMRSHAGK